MEKIPRWSLLRRKRFIRQGRRTGDVETAARFHMVAKLAAGLSCTAIANALGCAISTVSAAKRRFLRDGPEGLLDGRARNGQRKVNSRFLDLLRKVLTKTPQDFGWSRTTWSRELLCLELRSRGQPLVAPCTMGRALAHLGAHRGAPKPFVSCPWPSRKRERRIFELRCLAARSRPSEPVFYSDEVDIHLNPKIGRDWVLPGMRRYVRTPGKNKKHYLAGALNAATRDLTWVDDTSKSSALFCKLLWRLAAENKGARRIHLILDNYIIHSSKKTRRCLEQLHGRIILHFLPPYCPDENPIERRWLDVHSHVTRNHRCESIEQLVGQVTAYLRARNAAHGHRAGFKLRPRKAA